MKLHILHQDAAMVALDKPSGLAVHESEYTGPLEDTAIDSARKKFGDVFAVHRLDAATSGVLLLARSKQAAAKLSTQFEAQSVQKKYIAVVRGWAPQEGVIDQALPDANGVSKPARTSFRCLGRCALPVPMGRYPQARYSLIEATPETGRMHQIRRHFKFLSHPLVGDVRYGKGEHNRLFRDKFGLNRLILHAWKINFDHPQSGERVELMAPIDPELKSVFAQLGWNNPELSGEAPPAPPAESSAA
jgi:tRNA pseudouridine65 synthase